MILVLGRYFIVRVPSRVVPIPLHSGLSVTEIVIMELGRYLLGFHILVLFSFCGRSLALGFSVFLDL